MAAVLKGLKTIRENWKKTVFFSGVAVYGGYYLKGRYEDSVLRTAYCKEAKKYGDEALPVGQHSKRITVFLNHAAHSGKAKKLFEKNIAPILHLAGLQVTVVKSEYEGQVKKYMSVLEDTDGIVVAGGNGLLLEVVTGMMRRNRDNDPIKRIPIGVMPLGYENTHAKTLVPNHASYVKWLLDSAMAVVHNTYKTSDVMYIQGDEPNKNVYCVSGLEWGLFKDAEERIKSKNWWMGPLKHYWTYIRCSMKRGWPLEVSARGDIVYEPPCDGCSLCRTPPTVQETPTYPWHYWLLHPADLFKSEPPAEPVKDYSHIYNPLCGIQYAEKAQGMELTAKIHQPVDSNDTLKCIDVEIGPAGLGRTGFISEGWRRVNKNPESRQLNKVISAGSLELRPELVCDEYVREHMFNIDGEEFECMNIKIGLLTDHLHFYHKPA